jgi:hypothetical protein
MEAGGFAAMAEPGGPTDVVWRAVPIFLTPSGRKRAINEGISGFLSVAALVPNGWRWLESD